MVRRLLLLNGVGILCVILFHATGWGFTAMFSENWTARYESIQPDGYNPVAYHALRGIEQLVAFAIGAFIFVSGFFVAVAVGRNRETIGWKAIAHRLKYLIIPYALWSLLIWIAIGLEGRVLSPTQYGIQFVLGSVDPAYYFVPLLAQLYIVSPLLVPLAKRHWKPLLGSLALLQLGVYAVRYPGLDGNLVELFLSLTPKWFFPTRLFWFAFGMVMGFHLPALKQKVERLKWVWLSGAVAFFVLGMLEWQMLAAWTGSIALQHQETAIDGLYGLCVIMCFLAFATVRFPFANHIDALGSRSYGIYLVHSPVMQYVSRGLYHLAPWALAHPLLLQLLLVSLGLGVPLLIMSAVRRSPARIYYAYQFG